MPDEKECWISTIQGMDWDAGCPCETHTMIMGGSADEAPSKMEAHATTLHAIVVPGSLQGPYSVDQATKILGALSGRYLPEDEAERTKAVLVQKGFLKS